MKFAIITDSHIGPSPFYRDTNRIMSFESERVITELAETLNKETDIQFIAQLGDLSQDDLRYPSVEFDRENFKRALFYFQKFKAPVYHTVGNHDRENLTYDDLCALLQRETLHYSFDIDNYHCVFLYTRHFNHTRMIIEQDQIEWLKADLAATNRKTLVFMHHPISAQDLTGSFWFEGAPHKAFVENREAVRYILETSGKVIGVFNGHLHRNNLWKHNGIPYFTIQSCIEDVSDTGTPSKCFATVTVEGDIVSVEVRGGDPARLSV
jgi:3',5'-cyclic AMP phosphodiesterase CpdA